MNGLMDMAKLTMDDMADDYAAVGSGAAPKKRKASVKSKPKISPRSKAGTSKAGTSKAGTSKTGTSSTASCESSMTPAKPVLDPAIISNIDTIKSTCNRSDIESTLSGTDFLEVQDPNFFHGRLFTMSNDKAPKVTWKSVEPPRKDHDTPDWLTATEYKDDARVLQEKVAKLAQLMALSKRTVVYSGAGISTSAGVGQAAAGRKQGGMGLATGAEPTITHFALAALSNYGLIHSWVQQNHDGLPQKAGYPQEDMIEIHGSWYNPANPVVIYSGSLKPDLFERMWKEAENADLCIVMGTSLSGLNSDQVATKPAERSIRPHRHSSALGTVIINLQQTRYDGQTSIRIFDESDHVMTELLRQFSIPVPRDYPIKIEERVLVPYDAQGRRSDTVKMWLDLTPGQEIRLNSDHNVQGARQPKYMHIGADDKPAYGKVGRYLAEQKGINITIQGTNMMLGGWWIEAAKRGGPETLPIINKKPMKPC